MSFGGGSLLMLLKRDILEILNKNRNLETQEEIYNFSSTVLELYELEAVDVDLTFVYSLFLIFLDKTGSIHPMEKLYSFLETLDKTLLITALLLSTEKLYDTARGWLSVMYYVLLAQKGNGIYFKQTYDKLSNQHKIIIDQLINEIVETSKSDDDYRSSTHIYQNINIQLMRNNSN
jgi:hypothetical protein